MAERPQFLQYMSEIGNSLGISGLLYSRSGAFKETYRGTHIASGVIVAVKVLLHSSESQLRLEREIAAMRKCEASHFPRLFYSDRFTTRDGVKLNLLVEEFLHGGNLSDRLLTGRFSPTRTKSVAKGVIEAINALHAQNLVHRDIKPDNIMFRDEGDDPILVDFGLIRDLSKHSATLSWLPHGPGTPFFAAPEQLNNDKDLIDWRTDQFALGVVISLTESGLHPYQRHHDEDPGEAVMRVAAREAIPQECKQRLLASSFPIVEKMVKAWPIHRVPSLANLMAAFN